VRNCVEKSCKPKFGGPPGFQYPGAMWKTDGPRGPEIIFSYSINKEVGSAFNRAANHAPLCIMWLSCAWRDSRVSLLIFGCVRRISACLGSHCQS
jgi:hypothetical protein